MVPTRLSRPQLAYLRALAEGIELDTAARRFLGIERDVGAVGLAVVDRARAIARQLPDPAWRLLGVQVVAAGADVAVPPIDEWAVQRGYADWPHAELLALYTAEFGTVDASSRRRLARGDRLRRRRLSLVDRLEAVATTPAAPSDRLDAWLEPDLVAQLLPLGLVTLADLRDRIQLGGRWWLGIVAYGPIKANRLATYLETLIDAPAPVSWPLAASPHELSGATGTNRSPTAPSIDAHNDRDAIDAWLLVRARKSEATGRQYRREAERFCLWLIVERRRALSSATAEDCAAYLAFLDDVPARWINRSPVPRLAAGWAPFRGSLSIAAQRVAVAALHSLFAWLVKAHYLATNPWELIDRKLGDDPAQLVDDDDHASRAFTPAAWAHLHAQLDADGPSPATARLRWLLKFLEAVGLRADELLSARRAHLRANRRGAGWLLRVHGKGKKNRTVPVPSIAVEATRDYFAARGLDFESAAADTPLLGRLDLPTASPSYSALYQTLRALLRRAARSSSARVDHLDLLGRERLAIASPHWLRHTHATRAAERGVPLDVLQANLGQANPRTTARYYTAQIDRRVEEMERAFGEQL